jgi:hypothetical protein
MKLLIGQLAIIILVLGATGLLYLTYSQASFEYTVLLVLWIVVVITVGIWTRANPKKAFLFILVFYTLSIAIKDALYGGEYILTILFHLYFVASMVIGMRGTREEYKKLTDGFY